MKKGFSTIEMMIAMVVMITAAAAIIMISFGDQNFLSGGQTNAEAINKAKELLENAQAEARKDFRIVNPKLPATSDGYYTTSMDVEAYPPSPSLPDYFAKKITSHVSWTDDSKITRSVQLSTLVTNFQNAIGGDTCNSFLTGNWTNPTKSNFSLGTLAGDNSGSYPITDLDAYQGKLYISLNGSSITS